ncbi:GNAT family N-acetyltransferase [Pontibacter roseus]|uniref:GNAT family N-acetyltransferase n=1 Tax=Pontibacter roseus TaxID=336989 RepID=UPI001FE15BC1|nr:GNAT family N-acetyltransferase [Pontibacter roseus]
MRKITEQDAAAIARLSGQLGYSASVAATAQRIQAVLENRDHCGYVAVADEKLIGWIHGFHTFRLESDAFVEVGGLVVDADYRSKGIGLMLVEQVKAWALERGVHKIRVRCNSSRMEAHAFYRRIGFSESKEQKVFDGIS